MEESYNQPYIRLCSVVQDEGGFRAKMEIDVMDKKKNITRKILTVKTKDDLFELSGRREIYYGYKIENIDCTQGREGVEFENTKSIKLGQIIGSIDDKLLKREQIYRTIETHLQKELLYHKKGIKVLSLFFIDKVEKYRTEEGKPGIYAEMFEECYNELIAQERFQPLKTAFDTSVNKAHDGYFSQDKKGNYKNTKGDTKDDTNTYNTIMKDKEWLLSFDCPLRFIFSHSALKEGWDNPNVFQVCTLIDQKSTLTCRQKIGRGLRLSVNQNGDRIEDKNVNILHVISNETFGEFADKLQKEIEEETGMKFGVLDIDSFAGKVYYETVTREQKIDNKAAKNTIATLKEKGYIEKDGTVKETLKQAIKQNKVELPKEILPAKEKVEEILTTNKKVDEHSLENLTYSVEKKEERTVTYEEAKELIDHLEKKDYITKTGKMKDTMKNALKAGTLDLPAKFEAARQRFETIIKNADTKPPIKNASNDVVVKLKKDVVYDENGLFQKIWDKIKNKTIYNVHLNEERLIQDCIQNVAEMPAIAKAKIVTSHIDVDVKKSGITSKEKEIQTEKIKDVENKLPNILSIMLEECDMPKRLTNKILQESGRLTDFVNNPEVFVESFLRVIKDTVHSLEVDGISYKKLPNENYYIQEIFNNEEIIANLNTNAISVSHSVYDHIIYDNSKVERQFAEDLDNDNEVKLFFKLPNNFKIETPIGSYTPDWAIYMDKNGTESLYFVIETKGSTNNLDLREREKLKIKCGKEHFKALNDGIDLSITSNWKDFKSHLA